MFLAPSTARMILTNLKNPYSLFIFFEFVHKKGTYNYHVCVCMCVCLCLCVTRRYFIFHLFDSKQIWLYMVSVPGVAAPIAFCIILLIKYVCEYTHTNDMDWLLNIKLYKKQTETQLFYWSTYSGFANTQITGSKVPPPIIYYFLYV